MNKYIAHRGYSLKYKDNSWDAIQAALDLGYDGIEIDVQPCASGELCLYHDLYIGDTFIRDMTEGELRRMDVCFLTDVYALLKNVPVYLDIKGGVEAVVKFFEDKPHANITFCSFNRQFLRTLPTEMKKGTTFEMVPGGVYEYDMLTEGMDAVLIHWSCLNEEFLAYCRSKGIEVLTYTHKTPMDLRHISRFQVDGIITNGIT